MLKQRIVTALILLLVLLLVLFGPVSWAFSLFMAVAVACAAWEWARLSAYTGPETLLWGGAAALGCLAMTAMGWAFHASALVHGLMTAVSLLWAVLGALALRRGVSGWQYVSRWLRMAIGLCVLWSTWLAAVQLHGRYGVWFLLSVMALVWVADIAAYFCGKAFGKRKLAPSISPGKSWAGAVGGAIFVVLFAMVCSQWLPIRNFYAALYQQAGMPVLLAVALVLSVMSVVGDLVESLMKRSMGFKDSSQLLPGHGGVLDRVDALLPVLPMALTVLLWLDSMPVIG